MSDSSDVPSDREFSPPTSPVLKSPQTSPRHLSSDSDSSTAAVQPRKRRGQYAMGSMTSRTSIRRRLLEADMERGDVLSTTEIQEDSFVQTCTAERGNSKDNDTEVSSQSEDSSLDGSVETTDHSDSDNSDDHKQSTDSSSAFGSDEELSDEECENLFDGSSMKINGALLKILQLYVEERWTKKSLHKNINLIKELLPQPNSLPGSVKSLLKRLSDLTSIRREMEHFYCSSCQEPKFLKKDICSNCNITESGTFYEFSLEDQVKHMLEQRNLAAAMEFYCQQNFSEDDICDIRDGIEYKKLRINLKGNFDIVLVWNTDGVSLSNSSKQELWPVLAFVCEVPPKLRSSYIIVGGIYVDSRKPSMNMFLKPLVKSLKHIYEKGGISWKHPVTKEIITSLIVSPILSADAPAKAMVLNALQYNSIYGCLVCEQRAGKVNSTYRRASSPTVRQRTRRCFLYQEEPARIRTGVRMQLQASLAQLKKKPVKGMVREAVVTDIPLLDLGVCCCAEYMHNILLGVVKYMLELMLNVRGPWYIGDKVDEINTFISNCIKVPDFVKRLPRLLKEFHFFGPSRDIT